MDPSAQLPPWCNIADGEFRRIPSQLPPWPWGNIADGEPPLDFYIRRQQILADFSAHTGLAHKHSWVTYENGLVKACVVVDVPFQIPGMPQERTRAFYGETKGDLDSALESAAEVALRHLSDDYGFVIVDYNCAVAVEYLQNLRDHHYSVAAEQREKLIVEEELSRKRAAEIEAKQKEANRYKQAFDNLVQRMKDVCIKFAGLLPVRAGGPHGIEYVGPPSPPAGGFDKLALDLVQILQSAYDDFE
ncbi:unnamed protein product [Alopecurus aequalis]